MMRASISTGFLACIAWIPISAAGEAAASKPQLGEIKSLVYERSCLSVAKVTRKTELGSEIGTGFFVGGSGRMITVLSSIGETEKLEVSYGVDAKEAFPATLLAADKYTGLALLQVEGAEEIPALKVGNSGGLSVGDFVYGVAQTTDAKQACSVGRVAGRDKGFEGMPLATSVLRLNISPPIGAFGAPLLDREANLVGVLLLDGKGGKGSGYALPAELVGKILNDYEMHGRAAVSWLGFGMEMGTTTPEVRSLRKDSPAAKAGMVAGDVIVSIGGRKVSDYQDVIDACYILTAGVEVPIVVLRGLEDLTLKAIPALRDEQEE
jgi:S1-C subfamily serine protease